MDKNKVLDEIFNNDPLGILEVKNKSTNNSTPDERLYSSFYEINKFYESNGREPDSNPENVSEYQLYTRLKNIKESTDKIEQLLKYDTHNILKGLESVKVNEDDSDFYEPKEINSIDDILNSDSFNLLGNDENLFEYKHIPKQNERENTDFVARRKPCKDFNRYEQLFKDVQNDLATSKRKLINFQQNTLREKAFYVHNGILFYLEKINITQKEHYKSDGTRVREDGRTRCIFENGTESNMLKRSVEKILYSNGRTVTDNVDDAIPDFEKNFSSISDTDEAVGYIYVLKSKNADKKISSIRNLYKIGFSTVEVEERIKNAEKEPTYLMAPVEIICTWKCYNLNPQKFEKMIHQFFGAACLEFDIFDEKGRRHTPREWFIVPLPVIEKTVELIISGDILNYKYDTENSVIVEKNSPTIDTGIERAISIRQPYVEAILNGEKEIEYRSRKTNIRERVYLYASKTLETRDVFDDFGYKIEDCPTGLIVGSVEIVDCTEDDEYECYNWHLAKPERLDEFLKPVNQPQPGIWRPKFC